MHAAALSLLAAAHVLRCARHADAAGGAGSGHRPRDLRAGSARHSAGPLRRVSRARWTGADAADDVPGGAAVGSRDQSAGPRAEDAEVARGAWIWRLRERSIADGGRDRAARRVGGPG